MSKKKLKETKKTIKAPATGSFWKDSSGDGPNRVLGIANTVYEETGPQPEVVYDNQRTGDLRTLPLARWQDEMSDWIPKAEGLYNKYIVQRTDGQDIPGGKHDGCNLFVLDLDHDPWARAAIRTYCAKTTNRKLAEELKNLVHDIEADKEQDDDEEV